LVTKYLVDKIRTKRQRDAFLAKLAETRDDVEKSDESARLAVESVVDGFAGPEVYSFCSSFVATWCLISGRGTPLAAFVFVRELGTQLPHVSDLIKRDWWARKIAAARENPMHYVGVLLGAGVVLLTVRRLSQMSKPVALGDATLARAENVTVSREAVAIGTAVTKATCAAYDPTAATEPTFGLWIKARRMLLGSQRPAPQPSEVPSQEPVGSPTPVAAPAVVMDAQSSGNPSSPELISPPPSEPGSSEPLLGRGNEAKRGVRTGIAKRAKVSGKWCIVKYANGKRMVWIYDDDGDDSDYNDWWRYSNGLESDYDLLTEWKERGSQDYEDEQNFLRAGGKRCREVTCGQGLAVDGVSEQELVNNIASAARWATSGKGTRRGFRNLDAAAAAKIAKWAEDTSSDDPPQGTDSASWRSERSKPDAGVDPNAGFEVGSAAAPAGPVRGPVQSKSKVPEEEKTCEPLPEGRNYAAPKPKRAQRALAKEKAEVFPSAGNEAATDLMHVEKPVAAIGVVSGPSTVDGQLCQATAFRAGLGWVTCRHFFDELKGDSFKLVVGTTETPLSRAVVVCHPTVDLALFKAKFEGRQFSFASSPVKPRMMYLYNVRGEMIPTPPSTVVGSQLPPGQMGHSANSVPGDSGAVMLSQVRGSAGCVVGMHCGQVIGVQGMNRYLHFTPDIKSWIVQGAVLPKN